MWRRGLIAPSGATTNPPSRRAALAQLVRAPDCGSGGPPFDPGRRYHRKTLKGPGVFACRLRHSSKSAPCIHLGLSCYRARLAIEAWAIGQHPWRRGAAIRGFALRGDRARGIEHRGMGFLSRRVWLQRSACRIDRRGRGGPDARMSLARALASASDGGVQPRFSVSGQSDRSAEAGRGTGPRLRFWSRRAPLCGQISPAGAQLRRSAARFSSSYSFPAIDTHPFDG